MQATMIWSNGVLQLLDQRLLPHKQSYISCATAGDVATAIANMVVRGAPAIGVAAAFATVLAARQAQQSHKPSSSSQWIASTSLALTTLRQSRPTAVNLFWALDQALQLITQGGDDLPNNLERWAIDLYEKDISDNKIMGELGASLIAEQATVITHCNAGALATCGYGTALGVIRSGYANGNIKHVFASETRPWLQGSRLTAFELQQENIPCSLIVEGAAGHIMTTEPIDWVIVGADRITANGDVINKIGTYNLAVLAKYHGVSFMVVAPTATIDMATATGSQVVLEQRESSEVTDWRGDTVAPVAVVARNPAFDQTPNSLIDMIVTEKGLIYAPNKAKLSKLMQSVN